MLGILLHYDEGRLSDLYFVDPQWLCSMLAKVIAVPEVNSLHRKGGYLVYAEIIITCHWQVLLVRVTWIVYLVIVHTSVNVLT